MSVDKILVEGAGDKDFILALLAKTGKPHVRVAPPKEAGGKGNGVGNVLATIPLLVADIRTFEVRRAGILVDADHPGEGADAGDGGFLARRRQVTARLAAEGYLIPEYDPTSAAAGEVFGHPDGLAPVGLFIFPNHRHDGMLEDMLRGMVSTAPQHARQQELFGHAAQVVDGLPHKLFDQRLHDSKAKLGTFLAWQAKPPAFAGTMLAGGVFDVDAPACAGLRAWLDRVFVAEQS